MPKYKLENIWLFGLFDEHNELVDVTINKDSALERAEDEGLKVIEAQHSVNFELGQRNGLTIFDGREKKPLRDVITPDAFDYPEDDVHKHIDELVVAEYDGLNTRWPGPHQNVHKWWRLDNGYIVGFNENPSHGWSWPVIADPDRHAWFRVGEVRGEDEYIVLSRHQSFDAATDRSVPDYRVVRCKHKDLPHKGDRIGENDVRKIGIFVW